MSQGNDIFWLMFGWGVLIFVAASCSLIWAPLATKLAKRLGTAMVGRRAAAIYTEKLTRVTAVVMLLIGAWFIISSVIF